MASEPLILPEELTEPVREVLGVMCFTSGPTAALLRRAGGWDIPQRIEDEQAAVLHWLLKLALRHGDGWRREAQAYLESIEPKLQLPPQPAPPEVS
jgi:hypothetical protein